MRPHRATPASGWNNAECSGEPSGANTGVGGLGAHCTALHCTTALQWHPRAPPRPAPFDRSVKSYNSLITAAESMPHNLISSVAANGLSSILFCVLFSWFASGQLIVSAELHNRRGRASYVGGAHLGPRGMPGTPGTRLQRTRLSPSGPQGPCRQRVRRSDIAPSFIHSTAPLSRSERNLVISRQGGASPRLASDRCRCFCCLITTVVSRPRRCLVWFGLVCFALLCFAARVEAMKKRRNSRGKSNRKMKFSLSINARGGGANMQVMHWERSWACSAESTQRARCAQLATPAAAVGSADRPPRPAALPLLQLRVLRGLIKRVQVGVGVDTPPPPTTWGWGAASSGRPISAEHTQLEWLGCIDK